MRALVSGLLAVVATLGSGCLSAGSGYDLTRQTVHERTNIQVEDEDAARVRSEVLSKPLTAESAAKLALANNAAVEAALAGVGIGRAELMRAIRLPNPKGEIGVHFHEGEPDLEIGATIDIVTLLLLPARETAASERLDAASLEAAGVLLDIAYGAKVAFYEYQAAAQVLELRKTITFATAQSAEIAARLLEAGNVPELEALNERALYEETRLALARAEVAESAARERLNATLGLYGEDGARWKVEARLGDPVAFDTTNLESKAISKSIDLAVLKKRYGAASVESDVAWAEGFLPEIEVGVGAERDEGIWEVGPNIGVEVPLFYQGQAEVAAADARMKQAKSGHTVTAVRIRSTARTLTSQLRNAEQSAEFYRKTLLPLREKIVDQTLRQYNAMNEGPFAVLQAKRDQIEAARAYVEVLRDYWVTRAGAEMLLAGRTPAMPAASPSSAEAAPGGAARGGHD
ncbi:MAG: TolC family protein [Polyangiaceae bacterium]|nr:TolC family protein [Polyangiaceae bacterium]